MGGWYYNERKKEREFTADELQRWNQEVLSKNPRKPKKARKKSKDADADADA